MNPSCPKCGELLLSGERSFVTSEPLTGVARTWECRSCKLWWKKGQGIQKWNGATTVRKVVKF
jgi:hypothetical protein